MSSLVVVVECLPDCDWQRGLNVYMDDYWTGSSSRRERHAIANPSANRINTITDRPNICSRYWRSSRRIVKMSEFTALLNRLKWLAKHAAPPLPATSVTPLKVLPSSSMARTFAGPVTPQQIEAGFDGGRSQ